ncbi:MAG: hypothetical protein P4L92_18295, partial [Rudaea sp.]|nr:hypothetical protein [Rudaea sp.]
LKKITELRRSNISEAEQLDELMRSSVFEFNKQAFFHELTRIMPHAGRFCRSDQRSRAGDPSVWIGVRPLLMQRV